MALNSLTFARLTVNAASGYWRDIQDAIDQIAVQGGDVYVPEGKWDFVNVGEDLGPVGSAKVAIPAGVNVFGMPTERTSGLPYNGIGQNPNGQVVQWKTVLVIPWDAHGTWQYSGRAWFRCYGTGDPDKSSRISDIKFMGYRSINASSVTVHVATRFQSVKNFRVDK